MEQTESRMGRWMKQGMLFLKWLLYSAGIGLLVGGVAAAFHLGIDWAAELRAREPWILVAAPRWGNGHRAAVPGVPDGEGPGDQSGAGRGA